MKERKIKLWQLLLAIIIILAVVLIIINTVNKPVENQKSENVNLNYKSRVVNDITFENIKIYSKDGSYYFTAKAVNKTDNDLKISNLQVSLDDQTFIPFIGDEIKSKEYKMIFMETKRDLKNIKNVQINVQTQG